MWRSGSAGTGEFFPILGLELPWLQCSRPAARRRAKIVNPPAASAAAARTSRRATPRLGASAVAVRTVKGGVSCAGDESTGIRPRPAENRRGLGEEFDDGAHEGDEILRAAAGDPVAVAHHLLIAPLRARVHHIVADPRPRRELSPIDELGRSQSPSTVAETGNRLPERVEALHQEGALRLCRRRSGLMNPPGTSRASYSSGSFRRSCHRRAPGGRARAGSFPGSCRDGERRYPPSPPRRKGP